MYGFDINMDDIQNISSFAHYIFSVHGGELFNHTNNSLIEIFIVLAGHWDAWMK